MTKPYAIHFATWHNDEYAKTACGLICRRLPPHLDPQLTTDTDRTTCLNCRSKKVYLRHVRDAETKLFRAVTGKPVRAPYRMARILAESGVFVMGKSV